MDIIQLSATNLDFLNSQYDQEKEKQQNRNQKLQKLKELRANRKKTQQSQIQKEVAPEVELVDSLDFLNSNSELANNQDMLKSKSVQFADQPEQLHSATNYSDINPSQQAPPAPSAQVSQVDQPSQTDIFLDSIRKQYMLGTQHDDSKTQQILNQQPVQLTFSPMTSKTIEANLQGPHTPQAIAEIQNDNSQQLQRELQNLNNNQLVRSLLQSSGSQQKQQQTQNKLINNLEKAQNGHQPAQQHSQFTNLANPQPNIPSTAADRFTSASTGELQESSTHLHSNAPVTQAQNFSPAAQKTPPQAVQGGCGQTVGQRFIDEESTPGINQLINQLQETIKQQSQTITSQKAEIFTLSNQVESGKIDLNNYQSKNQVLLSQIQSLEGEIQQQNEQIHGFVTENQSLKDQCDLLKAQLSSQQSINSKLIINQNNSLLNSENEELKKQLNQSRQTIEGLRRDVELQLQREQTYKSEISTLAQSKQEYISLNGEQRNTIELQKQQLSDKTAEIAEKNTEISELQRQNQQIAPLQLQVKQQKEQIIQYKIVETENYQIKQEVTLLRQQITQMQAQKQQMQSMINQKLAEIESLQKANQIQLSINKSQTQTTTMHAQTYTPTSCQACVGYKEQIDQLHGINQELSNSKTVLQRQISGLQEEIRSRDATLQQLRIQHNQQTNQLELNQNEIIIQSQNIQQYENQISRLNMQIQQFEQQAQGQAQQIQNYKMEMLEKESLKQQIQQLNEKVTKQNGMLSKYKSVEDLNKSQESRIHELLVNEQKQDQSIKYVTNKYNKLREEFIKVNDSSEYLKQQYMVLQKEKDDLFSDNKKLIDEYQVIYEKFKAVQLEKESFDETMEKTRSDLQSKSQQLAQLQLEFRAYKEKAGQQVSQLMKLNGQLQESSIANSMKK